MTLKAFGNVDPNDEAAMRRNMRRLAQLANRFSDAERTVTSTNTSAYTAAMWDVVICDPSGGGFTVTLPETSGEYGEITVKNASTSTNTITIAASGTDTIDGAASTTITSARASLTFVAVSGGWVIV